MMDYRKTMEQAYQDIAVFMYGLHWWKDEKLKAEIFIMKKYENFDKLKPVWEKMAKNSKQTFGSKDMNEIFSSVAGDTDYYPSKTIEEALCLVTSEKLKTLDQ